MAVFTPVFHFGGQCADAMAFYAEALGGKINCRMTYAEADPADCAVQPSSAMFLNVTFDTKEEVRAAFDALSAGAKAILYAPRVTAYSSCHSSLVDRFGARWTLMTEQTER